MQQPISIAELKSKVKAGILAKDAGPIVVPRDIALVAESIDEEARTAIFVMSDFTQDFVGDRMAAEGAKLTRFKKNPQFLWAHDQGRLPIGTWLDVWIENGQLKGKAWFAGADLDAGGDVTKSFSEACWRFVKAGILKACSVFFKIINAEWNGQGLDILEWELAECSLVTVPANENALAAAKSAGGDLGVAAIALERARAKAKALDEASAEDGGSTVSEKELAECMKGLQDMQGQMSKALADHAKLMASHADIMGKHAKALADANAHADKLAAVTEDMKAALAASEPDDDAAETKKAAAALRKQADEKWNEAKKLAESDPAKSEALAREATELHAKAAQLLTAKGGASAHQLSGAQLKRAKSMVKTGNAMLAAHHAAGGDVEPDEDDPSKAAPPAPAPPPPPAPPAKPATFAEWFATLTPEQRKALAEQAKSEADVQLRLARGAIE